MSKFINSIGKRNIILHVSESDFKTNKDIDDFINKCKSDNISGIFVYNKSERVFEILFFTENNKYIVLFFIEYKLFSPSMMKVILTANDKLIECENNKETQVQMLKLVGEHKQ